LNLCLVGCGAIGRIHAEIFQELGAVLHTAVSRDPATTAAFANEFGFARWTTDLAEALRDPGIDAVIIASPNELHVEQTRAVLESGRPVLAEMPLAMSYGEGLELVELAERRGLTLMPAHSERFIPSLAALRERVAAGTLHIHHLSGRETAFRRVNVGWTGRSRSWTDNLLWHFGGHVVDFSLWLLGAREVEIQSQVSRPDPRTGVPMDLDIMMRTPADQLIAITLSFHSHFALHDYLIVGEEASFHFDGGRLTGSDSSIDDPAASGLDYYRLSWEAQNREFLDSLREGRAPSMSGADALPSLAILQEIENRIPVGGTIR
jgi:2-hydroxy-4-carboxymuconate semialdehyde hemiacetal dehydrogenase